MPLLVVASHRAGSRSGAALVAAARRRRTGDRLQWAGWGVRRDGDSSSVVGVHAPAHRLARPPGWSPSRSRSSCRSHCVLDDRATPAGTSTSLLVEHDRRRRPRAAGGHDVLSSSCSASRTRRPPSSADGRRSSLVAAGIDRAVLRPVAAPPGGGRQPARATATQRSPEEALQTFGSRMSRAIPLDELLLQLAESLKKSLRLRRPRCGRRPTGCSSSRRRCPHRSPPGSPRREERRSSPDATSRATAGRRSGCRRSSRTIRARCCASCRCRAPAASCSACSSCTRRPTDSPFNEEEDRVLAELARQVALALHNSRLDSALQASLDELQVPTPSSPRPARGSSPPPTRAAAQIERNLHDGAQQHLVALAVKLGLVTKLIRWTPTPPPSCSTSCAATCRPR